MNRKEWLAVRQRGIGSSDAAAAVGLNPYKSQLALWMEKTGRAGNLAQEDPNDEASPLYWGTLLEPIVAAHYTKRTGRRVRRINAVLQHPQEPWMLANVDREVLGDQEVQILECKTAGLNGARLWKDGVPEYVQIQVHHQLAVTGKQAADVAVLVCGQELRVHRIERDDALIARLVLLERQFWRYVEEDRQPPADGSESAHEALRTLYPQDQGQLLDLRADAPMNEVFAELLAVRHQLAEAAAREQQLKQQIQQRMEDASRALFLAGEVSWKRAQDSQKLDTDRLLRDRPELEGLYTRVHPGSRRFLVVS
ncbi:YqaJ viral recombinase family protein [Ramlibacter sp. AN1015]|uniref:YqaJ viral recombinase family nuclease n=1 Tax=Ramlibacter sp. AN1015 TaxID=3133428 RepID=UPI0030BBAC4C